jgi:hypothetical protein
MRPSSLFWGRVSDSRCCPSAMVTRGTRPLLLRLRFMLGNNGKLSAEREKTASDHGDNYY